MGLTKGNTVGAQGGAYRSGDGESGKFVSADVTCSSSHFVNIHGKAHLTNKRFVSKSIAALYGTS